MTSNPPSLEKGIAISIVLYHPNIHKLSRTLFHLKEALRSSEKKTILENSSLFLIDNSIPPLDVSILETLIKECYFGSNHPIHRTFLKTLKKNVGYGAAHNRAIWSHSYPYHLILNPDVYLFPETLTAFREYAERNSDVVLITPMVFSHDGTLQYLLRRDPSLLDVTLRFLALFFSPITKLKRYRIYECRDVDLHKVQDSYLMSGCCMWCRTEALQNIGGFDERFFLYCEDYDLSRRLRTIGRTVYLPHAKVIHDWEREMARSPRLMFTNIRSTITFFNKWGWKIL
ncbi:MAG: glycosyltransferase [Syntrophobacterales bacterium]|nr:glycosyltransferase [Syntrophobacterales bacterium]